MNRTFRIVFNRCRNRLVVADERTKALRKKGVALAVAAAGLTAVPAALALGGPSALYQASDIEPGVTLERTVEDSLSNGVALALASADATLASDTLVLHDHSETDYPMYGLFVAAGTTTISGANFSVALDTNREEASDAGATALYVGQDAGVTSNADSLALAASSLADGAYQGKGIVGLTVDRGTFAASCSTTVATSGSRWQTGVEVYGGSARFGTLNLTARAAQGTSPEILGLDVANGQIAVENLIYRTDAENSDSDVTVIQAQAGSTLSIGQFDVEAQSEGSLYGLWANGTSGSIALGSEGKASSMKLLSTGSLPSVSAMYFENDGDAPLNVELAGDISLYAGVHYDDGPDNNLVLGFTAEGNVSVVQNTGLLQVSVENIGGMSAASAVVLSEGATFTSKGELRAGARATDTVYESVAAQGVVVGPNSSLVVEGDVSAYAVGVMRTYGLRVVSTSGKAARAELGSPGAELFAYGLSEGRGEGDLDAYGILLEGADASADFKGETTAFAFAEENEEEDDGGKAYALSARNGARFSAKSLRLAAVSENSWAVGLGIEAANGTVTGDFEASAVADKSYATALSVDEATASDSLALVLGGEGTTASFGARGDFGATGIDLSADGAAQLFVNASNITFDVTGGLVAQGVAVSCNAELHLGTDATSTTMKVATTEDSSSSLYGIWTTDQAQVEVRGQRLDIELQIGSNDGRNQTSYGIAAFNDSQVAVRAPTVIRAINANTDPVRHFIFGLYADESATLALQGETASSVRIASNTDEATLAGVIVTGRVENPGSDLQFESRHDLSILVETAGENAGAYGVFAQGSGGSTALSFGKTFVSAVAAGGEAFGLTTRDAKVVFGDDSPLNIAVFARDGATGLLMKASASDASELELFDTEIVAVSEYGKALGFAASDTRVTVNGSLNVQAVSLKNDERMSAQALVVEGNETILSGNVALKAAGSTSGAAMGVMGARVETSGLVDIERVALEADMSREAFGLWVATTEAPQVGLKADGIAVSARSFEDLAVAVQVQSEIAHDAALLPVIKLFGRTTELSASAKGEAYGVRFEGTGSVVVGDDDNGEVTRISATSKEADAYGVYASGVDGGDANMVFLTGNTVTVAASAASGASYGLFAQNRASIVTSGEVTVTADRPVVTDATSLVVVRDGTLDVSGNAEGSIDGARFALDTFASLVAKFGMAYAYRASSGVVEEVTAARIEVLPIGDYDPGTLAIADAVTVTPQVLADMKALYANARLRLENASLHVDGSSSEVTVPEGLDVSLVARGAEDLAGPPGKITVAEGAILRVKASPRTSKAALGELALEGESIFKVADGADLALGSLTLNPSSSGNPEVYVGQNTDQFDASDSAGRLSVDRLRLNGGTVFIDPAWVPGMTVEDASHFAVTRTQAGGLDGLVIAGANGVFAYGTTNEAADAAFNAVASTNGLSWSTSGVNALMLLGAPLSFDAGAPGAGVRIDPHATADSAVTDGTVSVLGADGSGASMLVVDQAGLGGQTAIAGAVEFVGETYLGVLVTGETPVTLAESLVGEGVPTVVTDTPFYSGSFDADTRQVSFTFNADKAAMLMASAGVQAMAREADRHLAQSVSQRVFSGVRLAAGSNAWAELSGERFEVDRYDSGARFKADTAYGAVGVDFPIDELSFAGAALQFAHGTLRSGSASLRNKVENAGVSLYAGRRLAGTNVTLAAEAAFTRGTNDIEARVASLSGKRHVKTYAAGFSAGWRAPVNAFFEATATAGLRFTRIESDGFAIGSVAVAKQKQNLLQVPLRLALEGSFTQAGGASFAPSFGLTLMPTFGGRDVKAFGVKESVIDASPVQAHFGLTWAKDNLTAGAAFTAGAGRKGSSAIGAKLSVRYAF